MIKTILNNNFTAVLQKKIPGRSQLTNLLVEILNIEKEAVYRRLRGEVVFTFAEIAIVAQHLCISLDELIGVQSETRKSFTLILSDFEKPSNVDYLIYENYIRTLNTFQKNPSYSIAETWTTLPFPICYKYPLLTQFYIFKWHYQYHNPMPTKHFEEIHVDEKISFYGMQSLEMFMKAGETNFIFSDNLFSNFIKDLKFFFDIQMINETSMQNILKELVALVDYLEELTIRGTYKETGNNIGIYISEIDIDTNYSLIKSGENYLALLRTLVMSSAATTDESTYHQIKKWFTALKRLSTHISVSGEKERIQYFKTQRQIIKEVTFPS